ncbi:hypothetical protein [Kaistia sp. MMO-174]|uniref:hypothetical protein n=1 Tax=Kaistia sp. MMO-174 TaxID=3081256 RepID=UPI00301786E1
MVSDDEIERDLDQGLDEPALADVFPQKVEKPRINPKQGLAAMVYFVMDLRLRGQTRSGIDADETWVLLKPAELEMLEDIAGTLEWFRQQRAMEKARASGRRSWK